ncbi:uncharacterized protein LOC130974472 [Arachis stenosperma]|uniref:uncharacterized protein LOC130974472 n=1 Tax=Arachis stenosperma TaxID=217475 RepID=UPI0025AC7CE4|nr:uncharacterized protein LOC130974472 [Arachis stenosperma]
MNLSEKLMQPSSGELVGFSGERVPIKGYIWLRTTMGNDPLSRTLDIQYLIVDCPSPYNIILGRPALNMFRAVISTYHLCVKFQAQGGKIVTIHSDRQQARQCYNASLKRSDTSLKQREVHSIHGTEVLSLAELDPRGDTQERPQPADELQKIQLTHMQEQVTYIGQALQGQQRSELIKLLQTNADLFAWTPADMPGISPDVICHKLATNRTSRPIAQKKRNLGAEKSRAALEETEKLLKANFIKEIRFTTWLSNVVMVRKNSGKWRMCVDFTDLNKACPKDAYPLPCIDKLVDNTSGFKSLSFMDAYSGYNQILMHPEDRSKTAFITEHDNFCYRVMPFGLKNAGATYQRLVDKVFRHQIGRNIEIYVDDMVAKTTPERPHCDDLKEIFEQIRSYNMRLNPEKCAFGVQGGKFLGFMLTSRGIEANPEKCKAILNMASPKTMKEVQQLARRVAALSRFLPAVSSRSYLFFQTILKDKKFQWTAECERAFDELKNILSSPPVLQRPIVSKSLYLYLSVSNHSISSALVIETGKTQQPVYFVSRVMQPTEQRQILAKPELAGRLTKWSIELSEFDIQFQPRSALKAQILTNFITELTSDEHNKTWELHVDGASNREGSGAGIILKEGDEVIAEQALQFHFAASNNQAEYEALIAGLKLALSHQVQSLTAHCDSLLVVQQIRGTIPSTEPNQQQFRRKASFYTKIAGELYRRGFSQPLLKCLNKDEAREVMDEIHEGVCENHIGGRALAAKIARTGYYWPTMKRDCLAKVKACDKCQKHEAISTKPAEVLHSMEAEAANRVVLQAIKKKLNNAKGEWAELIPKILWSYNTTVQNTTGETPFRLVYGSEALIPVEIGIPTIRAELYDEQHNTRARKAELDLAEEDRKIAAIKQRAQKQLAEKKHNKKVVPRTFSEGDLVLRRTEEARRPHSHGKLATNWEGPFRISKVLGMGAYQLQTLQGNTMSGNWNVSSLKMYRS